MKSNLQWRPQEAGEARNVELLRKATGNEQSHLTETMRDSTTNNTVEAGPLKLFGVHTSHGLPQMLDMQLQDSIFALWVWFLQSVPFYHHSLLFSNRKVYLVRQQCFNFFF